ncbi:hypothetical protein phiA047_0212 [Aeromonas phage phiA047]|nr:hypothetical protein phiA047_0212 [Aeromonas phage phiA047]
MKLNKQSYAVLKKYSDDIIYDDKYEATLKQWLDSYGANIRSELDEEGNYCGFVTFGSAYAVWKMMERFRKQVVRETLGMLVEGQEDG